MRIRCQLGEEIRSKKVDCGGNLWGLQVWRKDSVLEIRNDTGRALAARGGRGKKLMEP